MSKISQTRVQIAPLIGLNQIQVIIHVNSKTPQNGFNGAVKGQSVVTHPATSVIKPSKSVSNNSQLPQTGENDGYQYSALGLLLGLNGVIAAVGAEKKRKKY